MWGYLLISFFAPVEVILRFRHHHLLHALKILARNFGHETVIDFPARGYLPCAADACNCRNSSQLFIGSLDILIPVGVVGCFELAK